MNIYDLTTKFTKYIKFLSSQFDIEVQFDSPEVKKEQNIIYLPKLSAMSPAEIDILWGVLLQEAGFIKYGELKEEENLLKLKTENQAKLIKLLEAVRIEKKLSAQFNGAAEMITPLYSDCVKDAKLKEKFYPGYNDVWSGICYALHQEASGVTDYQEELTAMLVKKTLVKKVNTFIETAKPLLKVSNTSTCEEVIKLSNKLHNLYFAGTDSSAKIDYKKTLTAKHKIEAANKAAQEKFEKLQEELRLQEERIKLLDEQLRAERRRIESDARPIQQTINAAQKSYKNANNYTGYKDKKEGIKNSIDYNEQLANGHKEKIQKNTEAIESIEERLKAGDNPQIEGGTEKNKDVLERLGLKENFDLSSLEEASERVSDELSKKQDLIKNMQNFIDTSEKLQKLEDAMQRTEKKIEALREKAERLSEKTAKNDEQKAEFAERQKMNSEETLAAEAKLEQLKQNHKNLSDMIEENEFAKEQKSAKKDSTGNSGDNSEDNPSDKSLDGRDSDKADASGDTPSDAPSNTSGNEDLQSQIEQLKESLPGLKEASKALQNELSKHSLDDTKKEKLEQKKEGLKASNEELTSKVGQKKEKIDKLMKEMQELDADHQELASIMGSMTAEEIAAETAKALKEMQEAQAQMQKLKAPLSKLEMDKSTAKSESERQESAARKSVLEDLKKVDEQFEQMGIDAGLLPKFVEMPDWDEANDVQRQFDSMQSHKTGELVTNGAGFEFKGYDTISKIIDNMRDVSEINIQDLFKDVTSMNPLDNFSKGQSLRVEDAGDYQIGRNVRPHVAATKEFDRVEQKNVLTDNVKTREFTEMKMRLNASIREMRQTVKQKFKFTKKPFYKGGKEEGDLDSRNMYKLATGLDDNFYETNNPKFINKIAASIVIDMSGSMNKDYTEEGKKIMKTALLLSEGLMEAHIPHEIIAFGAEFCEEMSARLYSDFYNRRSHSLKTQVLKGFNDKGNSGIGNFELMPIDNCDAESIEVAYNRLTKRSEKSKMVFVISDAKPFLNDADPEVLDEDVRRVMRKITQDKNHIFALGFNDGPEEIYAERYQKIDKWSDLVDFIKAIDLLKPENLLKYQNTRSRRA